MFFNEDKEIGTNLAVVITPFAINQMEQIKKEFLSFRQFSKVEAFRFRFCLMILNLAHAIWWVNLLESNTTRAKRIIDSMVETFMGAFERNQEPIRIGDLIVDPLEVALINNEMGQVGISKNTMTNYRSIMPTIYNKRVAEYFSAFKEIIVILKKEGTSSPLLFRPLAKYFVRHFTGDSWEKHANFVADLSPFLTPWNMLISNIVEECIKPERKQESIADSKFKSREEYEAWKARKIKENEEKRQSQKEIDIGKEPNQLRDAEYYFNKGYKYLDSEKYQEAIEAFKKAGLDMHREAIEAYRQAVRIQPNYTNAYLDFVSGKLGLYREAIEGYRQRIKIRPDDASAYYGLGLVYLHIGQKDKALEEYQKLKEINPKLAEKLFKQIYKF